MTAFVPREVLRQQMLKAERIDRLEQEMLGLGYAVTGGPQCRPAAELAAEAGPRWLIPGLIPEEALVVLYGPPGAGKSFLALDLAAHLAAGRDWMDRSVANPIPVIFVGAEGGKGLRNRIAALQQDRAWFDGRQLQVIESPASLHADAGRIAIHAMRADAGLIVIDTLARMIDGDENNSHDMGRFVKECGLIQRKTGATVIVIHHTGKDPDRGARGHSSLNAAADTIIEVKK